MCGRYSVVPPKEKKGASKAAKLLAKYVSEAHYNAAPSKLLPVVTGEKPSELQFFSWGLLPHWAKNRNFKSKPINARAETVTEKPSFRSLISTRRCIVPADGFYEWKSTSAGKQPYRFLLKSEELFSFAGLWDEWTDKETGEVIDTFTIITTEANDLVKTMHTRMPVLLHPIEEDAWLDVTTSNKVLLDLLRPYPSKEMKAFAVSPLINSVTNNTPEVMIPAPEQGSLF
jgi:putative SOS response-associated peptidase YedK